MVEFQPNSNRAKKENERVKLKKVTTGSAKPRKKGVADFLISEDFKSVRSYLVTDVLVPNVKKLIQELVTNGINQILYGNSGTSSNNSSVRSSHISYRSFSDQSGNSTETKRMDNSYGNVILSNRVDAEEILRQLDEAIDMYRMVSVADLYDLAGIQSEYTDQKYGWTDIRTATIVNTRDGFLLKMPRVRPL